MNRVGSRSDAIETVERRGAEMSTWVQAKNLKVKAATDAAAL